MSSSRNMYSGVLTLVWYDVRMKIRRLLLELSLSFSFNPTRQKANGSFYFILMYLLAEQSSLVCKCELSDRCDKKFN